MKLATLTPPVWRTKLQNLANEFFRNNNKVWFHISYYQGVELETNSLLTAGETSHLLNVILKYSLIYVQLIIYKMLEII